MSEARAYERQTISEQILLSRLQQSEHMREFFIQMWMQNPALAKQGGAKVQSLLTQLEQVDAIDQVSVPSGAGRTKLHGTSLIELLVFIVIISIALVAILSVMSVVTRSSADPLVHKQALAIAESLLEEVELMPFTICDPDDPSAVVATTAAGCTGGAGGPNDESALPLGPEGAASVGGAEGRYAVPQFDNVSDYNGFAMGAGAVKDINGTAAPAGYTAGIVVAQTALGGISAVESLRITVTVTGLDGVPITLDGYRTRYAPRSVP
jgi:MSHA pilin protein MshD